MAKQEPIMSKREAKRLFRNTMSWLQAVYEAAPPKEQQRFIRQMGQLFNGIKPED